jgi:hypothetical protein
MRTSSKSEEPDEERLARLKSFAARLKAQCDCPLIREKIEAILAGAQVDH